MIRLLTILLLFLNLSSYSQDVLSTLKPTHPRLIFSDSDFAKTKQWIITDSFAKGAYNQLVISGQAFIPRPAITRVLVSGNLLSTARSTLTRISILSMLYKLNGDTAYSNKAIQIMRDVSVFSDWFPNHFLDVAELTMAMALGYDWLYDTISASDKVTFRNAIINKGLKPGLDCYRYGTGFKWRHTITNWNQVCNGGLLNGALAIATSTDTIARSVIDSSLLSIPFGMQLYDLQGGFAEGLEYWTYGTTYNAYYIASLKSALGSDFGLLQDTGFNRTADYRIYMSGTAKIKFNYGDAPPTDYFIAVMLWFAKVLSRPFYSNYELTKAWSGVSAFNLLWYDPNAASTVDNYELPKDALYDSISVVTMRSSWADTSGWYIGFKGGKNIVAGHTHLDLGSFVIDYHGKRWAADMGPDNYAIAGYFTKSTQTSLGWNIYRAKTEAHNTLTISSANQTALAYANQDITANAPITNFFSAPDMSYAIIDLKEAYRLTTITKAIRAIRLKKRQVLIQDEITSTDSVQVIWNCITEAHVTLDSGKAILKIGADSMIVQVLRPLGSVFDTVSCHPAAPNNFNATYTKLVVKLPRQVTNTTIAVRFYPAENIGPPGIRQLSKWNRMILFKNSNFQ